MALLARETKPLPANPTIESDEERRRRFAEGLNIRFGNEELLERSLTHRSAGRDNNERLEFLGDAVLNFVVAEALYGRIPHATEGVLTRVRAELVRRSTLAGFARVLDLGSALNLGVGERKSGGRNRESILCDAFEALVGAYYLDAGLEACRSWLEELLAERMETALNARCAKDPKTELQEFLQARGLPLPAYTVSEVSGAAHEQLFTVACEAVGLARPAAGTGTSRRDAEQAAARQTLEVLRDRHES